MGDSSTSLETMDPQIQDGISSSMPMSPSAKTEVDFLHRVSRSPTTPVIGKSSSFYPERSPSKTKEELAQMIEQLKESKKNLEKLARAKDQEIRIKELEAKAQKHAQELGDLQKQLKDEKGKSIKMEEAKIEVEKSNKVLEESKKVLEEKLNEADTKIEELRKEMAAERTRQENNTVVLTLEFRGDKEKVDMETTREKLTALLAKVCREDCVTPSPADSSLEKEPTVGQLPAGESQVMQAKTEFKSLVNQLANRFWTSTDKATASYTSFKNSMQISISEWTTPKSDSKTKSNSRTNLKRSLSSTGQPRWIQHLLSEPKDMASLGLLLLLGAMFFVVLTFALEWLGLISEGYVFGL